RLHHFLHLARRANQRPDMLLHEDALVLHEAGPGDARHRLAGGVRDQMNVKIAVGHALFYPTEPPGETLHCSGRCGDSPGSGGLRPDSGPDSPHRSTLVFSADELNWRTCESGIIGCKTAKPGLSDPQASGEERLITPIPALRAPYCCYYLI